MAEITLKDVTKRFGKITAEDRMNLTIQDKEFVVVVGPSGCGKTTALRMITGLEDVTAGEIYIGDRMVNYVPPKNRDIAMVFQNYALYPHMNVHKNLSFGLKIKKFPKDEIDKRVREAARILGIEDLLERKPRQLSGGQRQRVEMGRAIVSKPQAYLFDEPLSNLDAKLRVQMRAELSKLHEEMETTIVYVTHDQVEAMTLADRIVVMNDGLVLQVGSPMGVYDNPINHFVAGFIGSPAMNFIDASVAREESRLVLRGPGFNFPIPESKKKRYSKAVDKDIIFGIRPEHIYAKEQKSSFPGGEMLRVTIDVVEPVGSATILVASFGPTQLTANVDPQTKVRTHDQIDFLLDLNRSDQWLIRNSRPQNAHVGSDRPCLELNSSSGNTSETDNSAV